MSKTTETALDLDDMDQTTEVSATDEHELLQENSDSIESMPATMNKLIRYGG